MAVEILTRELTGTTNAVADLSEDRLTAWAPDVAADADLPYIAEHPTSASGPEVMTLDVPTPGGAQMRVPIVHPSLLMALHHATAPLREHADTILAPGAHGYRYGASDGWHYAPAWRAFSDEVAKLARTHAWVAFTDVSSFFAHSPWKRVVDAARAVSGPGDMALAGVAERFRVSGQHTLPSGYADARFLSNLLLAETDGAIRVPFVRWVDDYRIFAKTEHEANAALQRAHAAMAAAGLQPNLEKTRVMPGDKAAQQHENTLASVYHPERDSREIVRDKLTQVLQRAIEDPARNRRDLRFSLSRLGREHDPAAVGWALGALTEIPWEAPRLVGYLSVFTAISGERERIRAGTELALRTAAQAHDQWLISRLIPLAWDAGIEERTARCLAQALDHLDGTPAWGLTLRLLAHAGIRKTVKDAVTREVTDRRGLLSALADSGQDPPEWLVQAEPALARVLSDGPLPPPKSTSLL